MRGLSCVPRGRKNSEGDKNTKDGGAKLARPLSMIERNVPQLLCKPVGSLHFRFEPLAVMEYSPSKYEGSMEFGRYHGNGVLHLADGYRYEGEFQNGEFHGHGTLFFPEGKLEGEWACGKQIDGTFTFSDGLEYAPTGWAYCTDANRQYYSESISPRGILPAGELNYFDTGVNRVVPLGSFDAGNGIYTPSTGLVSAYNDPSKTREPTEQEKEWIMTRAPKATTKDMSTN